MWPNDPYKELPLADLSIFISATAMTELRTFETKKEWAHRFGQVRLLRAFSLFRADIHWPLPGAARVLYYSPADGATQSDSNYTGYANATEFEIG